MVRLVALVIVCAVCLGCGGRSADNGAGFDQAVQDMQKGGKPTTEAPSEEFHKGYREAVDAIDAGVRRKREHEADQKRAQEFHELAPRKK